MPRISSGIAGWVLGQALDVRLVDHRLVVVVPGARSLPQSKNGLMTTESMVCHGCRRVQLVGLGEVVAETATGRRRSGRRSPSRTGRAAAWPGCTAAPRPGRTARARGSRTAGRAGPPAGRRARRIRRPRSAAPTVRSRRRRSGPARLARRPRRTARSSSRCRRTWLQGGKGDQAISAPDDSSHPDPRSRHGGVVCARIHPGASHRNYAQAVLRKGLRSTSVKDCRDPRVIGKISAL